MFPPVIFLILPLGFTTLRRMSSPYQADSADDNGIGGDGETETMFDRTRKKGVAKSEVTAPTAPAAPAAPTRWGEGSDGCDDAACSGFSEVEGWDGVIYQSSSEEKRNESDWVSSKIIKGRNSSTAPDASAGTDTGGDSGGGGGHQSYMGFLSPGVDTGWGARGGAEHSSSGTPPRNRRSPASSPGLTPLRGRRRRGWWRRRRDKYPTEN